MQLKLNLPEDVAEGLQKVTTGPGSITAVDFVIQSIKNELSRSATDNGKSGVSVRLDSIEKRLQCLENGQRALIILVGSSARLLASLVKGRRSHSNGE